MKYVAAFLALSAIAAVGLMLTFTTLMGRCLHEDPIE